MSDGMRDGYNFSGKGGSVPMTPETDKALVEPLAESLEYWRACAEDAQARIEALEAKVERQRATIVVIRMATEQSTEEEKALQDKAGRDQ